MRTLLVAALVLIAAGCGGGKQAAPSVPPPPKLVADDPVLPVAEFNRRAAASEEPWTRSPVLAAGAFVRLDLTAAAATSVVARGGAEGGGPTRVVVDLGGLPDDSIRAVRFVLAFEPLAGGRWRLRSARWSQRCNPGRGHQAFTAAACV